MPEGIYVSKKGTFNLEEIEGKTKDALQLAEHMELFCMEQPFLNYLIVTSGKKFTSLFVLDYRSAEKHPGIKHELWAGTEGWEVDGGRIFKPGKKHKGLLLVHWAGLWRPKRIEELLYRVLIKMRLLRRERKPQVGLFIPYRKLWEYYSHLDR